MIWIFNITNESGEKTRLIEKLNEIQRAQKYEAYDMPKYANWK